MDLQAQKQVWERIREPGALTAELALLPERLAALISQEETSAAACRQLAARLTGADANAMRRIRAQAQNRSRQLGALRFLYAGLQTDIRPSSVPFHAALCEALREEGLLLLTLQAQYEKIAAEFPAQTQLLTGLSAQVRQNLRTVTAVLQKCL